MFAFCLFMLPFTLQGYAPNGWKTDYIIAMKSGSRLCNSCHGST
jgi:hypothetical protein